MSGQTHALSFLKSLPAAGEFERLRAYKRFSGTERGLPFPLGHLLQGVHKQRESPAAFVDCVNWFFETAFRFLLATAIDPLARHAPLGDDVWPLLDALLDVSGTGPRDVGMGGWRDLCFASVRRAIENPEARKRLPGVLRRFFDTPAELAQLGCLFDVFVAFRNRIEHGRRDGNVPQFMKDEAELYERGLLLFLRELESLSEYGLLLRSGSQSGGLVLIDGRGEEAVLVDQTMPNSIETAGRGPVPDEVFLGELDTARERLRGIWSLHPFMRVEREADGRLRACLFRCFVPRPPRPHVIYDIAMGHEAPSLELDDPTLVELLERLAETLRRRHAKRGGRATNDAAVAAVAQRIADEEAQTHGQEQEAHRAWLQARREEQDRLRRVQHNWIPYPHDPHFKGRQAEMHRIVTSLQERRSVYIRGLGGVGKTALAVQLCHDLIRAGTFADGVLWYRVREQPLEEAVAEAGADIELGPDVIAIADPRRRVQAFRQAIRGKDLLVVLDNADFGMEVMQPLFDLFRGLPLLVTSRRDLPLHGVEVVPLGGLAPQEARDLVIACLASRHGDDAEPWRSYGEEADVQGLCEALDCHPLALKLAAHHTIASRLTLAQYIDLWRHHRLAVVEAQIAGLDPAHHTIRACLDLSFRALSAPARRLLARMSEWEGREFAFEDFLTIVGSESWAIPMSGHEGPVTAWVRPWPDAPWIVTGGRDGRVLLWREASDGTPACDDVFAEGLRPITDLITFRPRGVAAQDAGGECVLVDLGADGKRRSLVGRPSPGRRWPLCPLMDEAFRGEAVWRVAVGDGALGVDVSDGFVRANFEDEPPRAEPSPAWLTVEPLPPPAEPTPADYLALGRYLEGRQRRRLLDVLRERKPGPDVDEISRELEAAPVKEQRPAPRAACGHEAALKQIVSRELLAGSLVIEHMTTAGLRLRLHPLVSEFAASHADATDLPARRIRQCKFYLDQLREKPETLAHEEPNVQAAVDRFLETAKDGELAELSLWSGWLVHIFNGGRWHQAAAVVARTVEAAERTGDAGNVARRLDQLAWIEERLGRSRKSAATLERLEGHLDRWRACARIGESREGPWTQSLYSGSPRVALRDRLQACCRRHLALAGTRYEPEFQAWRLRSVLGTFDDIPQDGHIALRLVEEVYEKSDDGLTARGAWASVACALPAAARQDLLMRYLSAARRDRDVSAEAHALSLLIAEHVTIRGSVELDRLLADYDALAELRDVYWARGEARGWHALEAAARGQADEARALLRQAMQFFPEDDASLFPGHWRVTAALLAARAGDLDEARDSLDGLRSDWGFLGFSTRCLWHLVAAMIKHADADQAIAAERLACHLAYAAHLDLSWAQALGIPEEVAKLRGELDLSDEHIARAGRTLWGFQGRSRVCVNQPRFLKKGRDLEHANFLVPPCFLRPHPLLVGELRAWSHSSGQPLPWYYRVHRQEAAEDEPARFVPYDVAVAVAEWLGEMLPGSYGWIGLPPDVPWGLAASLPVSAPGADVEALTICLRNWAGAEGAAWERMEQVLAAPMTAIDKWRLCDRIRRQGARGLPEWVRVALDLLGAPDGGRTAGAKPEVDTGCANRDLRSVAFLAGVDDAVPDGLWLSPEEPVAPRTRWDAHGLGAVGHLCREAASNPRILVPDSLAWADVVAWPGTLVDLGSYDEEAPPWPSS